MTNVKRNRKILRNKEIEYGSTKKKYIDKNLEETLRKSGFERKPKSNEPRISKKAGYETLKVRLPKNIDSEIIVKAEKKVKKVEVKPEKIMIDLPSHLEFEAPETIQVKTGIKRLVDDTEGAEYGELPEEIDIVHEETKEEKKKRAKSFFSTIKQTLGFSDNEEEDLEAKRESLLKRIEKREGNIKKNPEDITMDEEPRQQVNDVIEQEVEEPIQQRISPREEVEERQVFKKVKEEIKKEEKPQVYISDEDESGLEPIKFTDKKAPEERKYDGYNTTPAPTQSLPQEPEVLENEQEEDSSIDIFYSKPKKKQVTDSSSN